MTDYAIEEYPLSLPCMVSFTACFIYIVHLLCEALPGQFCSIWVNLHVISNIDVTLMVLCKHYHDGHRVAQRDFSVLGFLKSVNCIDNG